MSWDDIPEQDAIISLLKNQLRQGKINHAYLFLGTEGAGKHDTALEFASAALCENQNLESCGKCLSCQKIAHKNHPDVQKFSPVEGKNKLGIDIIRELQRRLALKPFASNRRFFIIEEADNMTEQAANCLLKSLESPPDYAVLILLASEESRLLSTVLSRCQKLRFHSLSQDKIVNVLQQHGYKNKAARHLARLAGGSPGKAKKLAENEKLLSRRKKVFGFLSRLTRVKDVEIFQTANSWADWLEDEFPLLDLMLEFYRDIIVYKQSGISSVRNQDFSDYISQIAENKSSQILLKLLERTESTARDIEANVRPELALQVLLFELQYLLSNEVLETAKKN